MSADLVDGNRLALLRNGAEYFPALESAIDAAHYEIHLQSYIFADDITGRRIADALARAARRGVTVNVVVDGYGTRNYLGELSELMPAASIQLLIFRPELGVLNLSRQRLRRMHRKIALIDRKVAFVGGINIIDDMHTPKHTPPRYDYAVRIEGPVLWPIIEQTRRLWRVVAWANLKQNLDAPPRVTPALDVQGWQRAAFVVRDNFRYRSDIEDAYLEAIEAAQEEIVIANAYFFPGRRFRRALAQAAERGVNVILLLQGRVEYVLLHHASRALYGSLLDSGVEIHEYHKSFLHAKVAVVDGRWATVGSSNIDPFSLMLAREANLVVDDRRFALELRESLAEHMSSGAIPVARQSWRRRPLRQRLVIWAAYGIARVLMGLFGYGGRH